MDTQVDSKKAQYEEALLRIVRALPPERVSEIVDFARFVQLLAVATEEELDDAETEGEVQADEEKWDRLLALPEAQQLLEQMADEALTGIKAGQAAPMIFTKEGEIEAG